MAAAQEIQIFNLFINPVIEHHSKKLQEIRKPAA